MLNSFRALKSCYPDHESITNVSILRLFVFALDALVDRASCIFGQSTRKVILDIAPLSRTQYLKTVLTETLPINS